MYILIVSLACNFIKLEAFDIHSISFGKSNGSLISYLETNFKSKNGGKKVVRDAQVVVARTVLVHGVLRGQGDAGDENHEHDKVVEQLLGHNPVNCLAYPKIREVKGWWISLSMKCNGNAIFPPCLSFEG